MLQVSKIAIVSEQMRKNFSEKLRQALGDNETMTNAQFNDKMRQALSNHTIAYLQDQFRKLYDALDNISSDKKAGDDMSFKIKELEQEKVILTKQVAILQEEVNVYMNERDRFREDTKEIIAVKHQIYMEKLHMSIKMVS